MLDGMLGEIPILNFLTGYLFNPKYAVTDLNGNLVARISKEASFFGRRFIVTKEGQFGETDDDRVVLGLMMLVLMERTMRYLTRPQEFGTSYQLV